MARPGRSARIATSSSLAERPISTCPARPVSIPSIDLAAAEWSELLLSHLIPSGPKLTSGAFRPSLLAASAGTGSEAVGRALADSGQRRTKSPPGPNWHNGRSVMARPPLRASLSRTSAHHNSRTSVAERTPAPQASQSNEPAFAVTASDFWSLFASQSSLTSTERQFGHQFFPLFSAYGCTNRSSDPASRRGSDPINTSRASGCMGFGTCRKSSVHPVYQ